MKNRRKNLQKFSKNKWNHFLRHGGELRKKRAGRKSRPLSSKEPLHLVFKANKPRLKRRSFRFSKEYLLTLKLTKRYAKKFFIKVEQMSVQNDHIHLLIRTGKRSQFQSFFRVLAGQIAQEFERQKMLARKKVTDTPTGKGMGLWLHRPYSRVVRGWKAYQTARNYVALNELEVTGKIPYRKERLRGLLAHEWKILHQWLDSLKNSTTGLEITWAEKQKTRLFPRAQTAENYS
jgi:putative transposase